MIYLCTREQAGERGELGKLQSEVKNVSGYAKQGKNKTEKQGEKGTNSVPGWEVIECLEAKTTEELGEETEARTASILPRFHFHRPPFARDGAKK